MKPKTKQCQNCKIKFTIEPEDFEFYKKIDVPEPTWCPDCRIIRRMSFKNERSFYRRKCDLCNKSIIAIYSQDAPFPVYCPSCWWSDKWDAMDYGKDYDFNKPFFTQFKELFNTVPRINLLTDYLRSVNSEYSNYSGPLKNCYLIIQAEENEDCSYSSMITHSQDSIDCLKVTQVQRAYELFNCESCYNTFFSSNCFNCSDVYFSKNLNNCTSCFGCNNLRHKKYHIFNKAVSKDEYKEFISSFQKGSYKEIEKNKKESSIFHLKFPNKYFEGFHNNNVLGNYITASKNVFNSFEITGGEDLKYCFQLHMPTSKDCYDYGDWGNNASLVYDSINCGEGINNVKFSFGAWIGRNWEYCDTVVSSNYIFGSIATRKEKYCILNKQYSKEEYGKMVAKIKQHMNEMPYTDKQGRTYKYGEFFPVELSPFAYNETIDNEYFPLTKEQAIKQGYTWYDKPKPEYQATIKAFNLPDHIKDIDNKILKEVIECSSSNCAGSTVYRIIPNELKFYQKQNIPLPRLCPDCRHRERIKQRNPMKLWKRQCMNPSVDGSRSRCKTIFQTTYAPDRKEIVYCEKCYNKEVG